MLVSAIRSWAVVAREECSSRHLPVLAVLVDVSIPAACGRDMPFAETKIVSEPPS